jgi:hemerythrin-like domain-containing protein
MAVQIGAAEPGFDDPVGLMTACHRRIERFLAALSRIANDRAGGILETPERHDLGVALRYFREAAPHHTADEEQGLFPELATAEPGSCDAVNQLRHDHRRAEQLHDEVDRAGLEWLRQGTLDEQQTARMQNALDELTTLYREHIRIEEEQVFPKAAQRLPRSVLDRLGQQMANRRGVVYVPRTLVRLGQNSD